MADVLLRNVVKRYGNYEAVRGISLEIPDTKFVALVGPSGCGKTTTLRMIAGLEDVSEGDICIGGRVINDVAPKNRDIAMVFQSYALVSAHDGVPEHGVRASHAGHGQGRDSKECRGRRAHSRYFGIARPAAEGAFRRPAPARRHGPRHCPQSQGVPVRRAAEQSGCQAAGADAHRDQAGSSAGQDHDDLCHPRSDRGHDAGRHRRGDEPGADRAGRHAARALSFAENPFRRRIHGLAGDEFSAMHA